MIAGSKIVVVLPAYNAARTLERTVRELDRGIVDHVILVDDASTDETVALARELGIETIVHERNRGYGANQKTCYAAALARGADVVVMLHPDYQYSPRLVPALASMVASGVYDVALGSRILCGGTRGRSTSAREPASATRNAVSDDRQAALRIERMPRYKYVANRFLTLVQNLLGGSKLSEFHTGFRAWSREVLTTLPLGENADGFVFDNQMLAQALRFGFRVGEISCPARYFPEASSIGLLRSIRYGFGVLGVSLAQLLDRMRIRRARMFRRNGRKLDGPAAEGEPE